MASPYFTAVIHLSGDTGLVFRRTASLWTSGQEMVVGSHAACVGGSIRNAASMSN